MRVLCTHSAAPLVAASLVAASLVAASLVAASLVAACNGDTTSSPAPETGAGPRYARRAVSVDPALPLPRMALAGTRISLEPPGGFEPAEGFLGFHRADLSASILVDENAVPLTETLAGLTAEALETAGLVPLSSEDAQLGERPALLLHLRQDLLEGRAPIEKFLVVVGDELSTATVTLVYPVAQEEQLERPMRQAALSVRWDPSLPFDPFQGLPYRIDPPAPLLFTHRSQNRTHYAATGWSQGEPDRPQLVAGPTVLAGTDLAALEQAAVQRLRETNGVTHVELERSEAVAVGNLAGWECVGTALDAETRAPIALHQLLVVAGERAFLVKGRAPRDQQAEWLPRFEQAARSLRLAP